LFVTETWMHAELPPVIADNIAPSDYAVTHCFWLSGQGGGIAVMYRRELQLSTLTVTSECHVFNCLIIKPAVAGHRLHLGAVY